MSKLSFAGEAWDYLAHIVAEYFSDLNMEATPSEAYAEDYFDGNTEPFPIKVLAVETVDNIVEGFEEEGIRYQVWDIGEDGKWPDDPEPEEHTAPFSAFEELHLY